MGHIAAKGSEVTGWQVGDRVTGEVSVKERHVYLIISRVILLVDIVAIVEQERGKKETFFLVGQFLV